MVIFIQSDLAVRQNSIQDHRVTELKRQTSYWVWQKLLEVLSGGIISLKVSATSSFFAFYTCYNGQRLIFITFLFFSILVSFILLFHLCELCNRNYLSSS